MGEPLDIVVDGIHLPAWLSRPPTSASIASRRYGLVLTQGFPIGPWGPASTPEPFATLADRLANDSGWIVLTSVFRGAPGSQGHFSVNGWVEDTRAAVGHLLQEGRIDGVWLAGFSLAGTIALCVAAQDPRVRGVASFAAPADLHEWVMDPRRTLEHFRSLGLTSDGEARAGDGWAKELRDLRPLDLIARIPPRPVLLVHGADDELVPAVDARALADAAEGQVEMRVLAGAGHGLRYDPRAVAILLGWLDRQEI